MLPDWGESPRTFKAVQLIDTATAAVALGITDDGVRKLGQRKELTKYGTKKRRLWDLEEVLDRAEKKSPESFAKALDAVYANLSHSAVDLPI